MVEELIAQGLSEEEILDQLMVIFDVDYADAQFIYDIETDATEGDVLPDTDPTFDG